jgi:hypothetical protein
LGLSRTEVGRRLSWCSRSEASFFSNPMWSAWDWKRDLICCCLVLCASFFYLNCISRWQLFLWW